MAQEENEHEFLGSHQPDMNILLLKVILLLFGKALIVGAVG